MNNTPDTQPEEWAVRMAFALVADSIEHTPRSREEAIQWYIDTAHNNSEVVRVARSFMQLKAQLTEEHAGVCEAFAAKVANYDDQQHAANRCAEAIRNLHTKQQ